MTRVLAINTGSSSVKWTVLAADRTVIAGGSESVLTPLAVGGFSVMKALSTRNDDPLHASRPWDKDRDGFVMGEGAGPVGLEEREAAKKRGACCASSVFCGISLAAFAMCASMRAACFMF